METTSTETKESRIAGIVMQCNAQGYLAPDDSKKNLVLHETYSGGRNEAKVLGPIDWAIYEPAKSALVAYQLSRVLIGCDYQIAAMTAEELKADIDRRQGETQVWVDEMIAALRLERPGDRATVEKDGRILSVKVDWKYGVIPASKRFSESYDPEPIGQSVSWSVSVAYGYENMSPCISDSSRSGLSCWMKGASLEDCQIVVLAAKTLAA